MIPQPFNTFGKIENRPQFPQLPISEVGRIAQMHAENNFNLSKTAKELGMTYRGFLHLIAKHSNLRMAICQQKRLRDCFRPYGPKRGELYL